MGILQSATTFRSFSLVLYLVSLRALALSTPRSQSNHCQQMEDGLPWCPLTRRAPPPFSSFPLPNTVCGRIQSGRVRVCLVKTACLIIITFRTAVDTHPSMPRPLARLLLTVNYFLVAQMNRSFWLTAPSAAANGVHRRGCFGYPTHFPLRSPSGGITH